MNAPASPSRRPIRHARAVGVVMLALGGLGLAACGSSGSSEPAATDEVTTTSTTEVETTTSTTEATTTTTEAPAASQPDQAIWPFAGEATRFDDPVEAARSFVVDYLGFVDPVVEEFQQGDSRSGEVPVRSSAQGPVTTVLVRQVTDDTSWWVIGASTPNLQIETPEVMAVVGPPLTVSGQSTAFEASINLEVRQDGSSEPLLEQAAMGGANGEMGPFSTVLEFESPNEGGGALVVRTFSMEDGRTQEASVLRIRFA